MAPPSAPSTPAPPAPAASTALTLFVPGDPLDRAAIWAGLASDARRRRGMEAARDHDPAALWALTDAWLTLHGTRGATLSRYTRRNYCKGVRTLLEAWTTQDLLRPHRDAAALWLRRMETTRQKPAADGARGLKPATVTVHLAAARALYAALRWAGATTADPFRDVRTPVDRTPHWEKRSPYSASEVQALLDHADPVDQLIVLLAGHGGLRAAELVTVRWGDLSLLEGTLRVQQGKGGKQRQVALSQSTVTALRASRAARAAPPGAGDYVLPFSTKTARVRMYTLCDRAGVPRRGLHALRHTAGTRLHRETGSLETVARHLGHQSVDTAAVYAKWSDERLRATMETW